MRKKYILEILTIFVSEKKIVSTNVAVNMCVSNVVRIIIIFQLSAMLCQLIDYCFNWTLMVLSDVTQAVNQNSQNTDLKPMFLFWR